MKNWIHSWWVTLKHGTILTKSGRRLRKTLRTAKPSDFVEVQRPS